MASSIETTSTTTTLKNNGNTYLSVDTNDDVAITNTLTATSPTFVTPNIGAATVTSLNGGQLAGNRNIVINGAMSVSQRGSTFTSPSAGAFTLDRFKYNENFGAVCTITQSTDAPSSEGFINSLKIDVTTAATPANAEEFKMDYNIEGQDFSRAGFGTSGAQALTLSFWVKSNVTGTYRVNFLNLNGTGNKIVGGTYIINSSSTWEKKTISIPADTTQATYTTNAEGFRIEFYLASGSDRTSGSLPTSWIAYDATRRASGLAVNLASSTANEYFITGVQLEVGSVATPFETRSYGTELALCQRYYQRLGQGFTGGTEGTTQITITEKFQVAMRAAPSSAIVSGQTCNIRYKSSDVNNASPALVAPSSNINGLWTLVNGFTGLVTEIPIQARNNVSGNLFIAVTAEL